MAPEEPRFERRLGASDAVLWDIEKDPVLRSTITAVALLDGEPDWGRLVRRLEHGTTLVPRLRQRIVVPPLRLGPPQWVEDARFDLDYHLRRVRAPRSGGEDPLRPALDVAEPLAMAPFDRARPLWEFTLVEGLPGGGAALVQKVHHCLTDGVGGMRLALMLLDETADAPEPGPRLVPRPTGDESALSVLAASASDRVRQTMGATTAAAGVASGAVLRAAREPIGAVGDATRMVRSLARLLRPVTEPCSPIMTARSLTRRFEAFEVPFAALHAAGHAAGGSVNDAFLAAVAGGLADYHRQHRAPLTELRFTMPINVRQEGDPLGGNRFVPARFTVPAGVRDPAERIRVVGRVAHEWRNEPALGFTEPIAAVLDRLPVSLTTSIFGAMLKGVDAVVTNVPGLPGPVFLAGAEVVREWAFAPPSGAALSVALLSHAGTGCVGLTIDTASVPDPDLLTASLVTGFAEVLALAESA